MQSPLPTDEQTTTIATELNVEPTQPIAMYSVPQLAYLLGLSQETLLRWRLNGSGPAFVVVQHKQIYYLRDDIMAWLLARRVDPREKMRLKMERQLAAMAEVMPDRLLARSDQLETTT
jgi:hypothetical protein